MRWDYLPLVINPVFSGLTIIRLLLTLSLPDWLPSICIFIISTFCFSLGTVAFFRRTSQNSVYSRPTDSYWISRNLPAQSYKKSNFSSYISSLSLLLLLLLFLLLLLLLLLYYHYYYCHYYYYYYFYSYHESGFLSHLVRYLLSYWKLLVLNC